MLFKLLAAGELLLGLALLVLAARSWPEPASSLGAGSLGLVFMVTGVGALILSFVRDGEEALRELARTQGIDATVIVRALGDTGVTVNKNPQVRFELSVIPAEGEPYELDDHVDIVGRLCVGALRPGARFPAKRHPERPEVLVVDWATPLD
ncbi:MAG: hypothetical protein H6741_00555 [Alphaproteobacteria bacterium]|nr:hypothetical protein [Alphaproteobacteria bacterium]MCB9791195.1 hypothetical protein [Alphaproteobacteria bacterium]